MRLCILSSWPSVHTEYWLKNLQRNGHEIHFILPAGKPENLIALPEGINVYSLDSPWSIRGLRAISRPARLCQILKKISPDIFHVHSLFAVNRWLDFPWVLALCSFHPLVLTAWGSDLLVSPISSKAGMTLIRKSMRSADAITGDSKSVLDAARSLGGNSDRCHEIQFGVDNDVFKPVRNRNQIRDKYNLGQGPVIFSPRALMPLYNQLKIVDSIPFVLRQFPDAIYIFKIRSDHHDVCIETQLKQRIKDLNVEKAVRIFSTIPYETLPEIYSVSDVMISIPQSDGTPRSILEGMACGAFPLVSDVPALHEWVIHGENGIILSSLAPDQIGTAILNVLTSSELLNSARSKNREIILKKASNSYWISRMEEVYTLVIRQGEQR